MDAMTLDFSPTAADSVSCSLFATREASVTVGQCGRQIHADVTLSADFRSVAVVLTWCGAMGRDAAKERFAAVLRSDRRIHGVTAAWCRAVRQALSEGATLTVRVG